MQQEGAGSRGPVGSRSSFFAFIPKLYRFSARNPDRKQSFPRGKTFEVDEQLLTVCSSLGNLSIARHR